MANLIYAALSRYLMARPLSYMLRLTRDAVAKSEGVDPSTAQVMYVVACFNGKDGSNPRTITRITAWTMTEDQAHEHMKRTFERILERLDSGEYEHIS